ncbi:threonine 3-dehydrogenase [Bacilli bacterium PM5-3]|nr:threonine 3-dehydrogenase [Bacilli bacterium PM5-3]MDH6603554.1 threonine 3-dehydrogenase [Bacilli bacterium PM5-9]
MRAIVKTKAEKGFELLEIDEPMIQNDDEIKIKVIQSSICGTDYHIYKWDDWSQKNVSIPHINGHEGLAEVVEVGKNVTNVCIGDKIAYETHYYCGHCYMCTTGNSHVCENMKILGVHTDGVWADYAVIPANIAFKIDPRVDLKYAALMEPLGNAVHTINYSNILGKHVIVAGAGPIGLMAAEVAKKGGAASVIVLEMNEFRKGMLKDVNVDAIIDPAKEDAIAIVKEITNGRMADICLEMTGSHQAFNTCIDLVHNCAEINVLSVFGPIEIPVRFNDIVFKNLKIQGVTGRRIFDTWHIVNDLLANIVLNKKVLDAAITHEFAMEDFEKAFETLESGKAGKIILSINK